MELVKYASLDINSLSEHAKNSPTGSYREIFHQNTDSKMQFMLIAICPDKVYDYIRDDQAGFIAFNCLYGSIAISIIKEGVKKTDERYTKTLTAGDIIYLPRRYWRQTRAGNKGAIYTESIEGTYNKDKRQKRNQSVRM